MTLTLNVSYEEAQAIRYGLALAMEQARASARVMKNDPLEVYRNKEVEKKYKAIERKIASTVDVEVKKLVDSRKARGVS